MQSHSNGHLPYYCSLYYFSARGRCVTWHVNFVRSMDVKQLARMSLSLFVVIYFYRIFIAIVDCVS